MEWLDYKRHPAWRPLSDAEIASQPDEPKSGIGYFFAAAKDAPKYYWETS